MPAIVPVSWRVPSAGETRIGRPVLGRTLITFAGAINHLNGIHARGVAPTAAYQDPWDAWENGLVPAIGLVLLLGLETDFGRELHRFPAPEETLPAKPVVVSLMPEYAINGGAGAYTETVARTLFNPTRRPAPVAAPH